MNPTPARRLNLIGLLATVFGVVPRARRRQAALLLGLMFVGMAMETLGVGLVIPALALMTQPGYIARFPLLSTLAGGASETTIVAFGMFVLVAGFVVKTLFLTYLAWRQVDFVFETQAGVSQALFRNYLRQPYVFHLSRNSAELIRNIMAETNQFGVGALIASITLVTELLVLAGVGGLLLWIEPLGAILVIVALASAAYGFHRFTRGGLARGGEARQLHEGLRLQHLQQGLGGVKEVKILGREEQFLAQYALHNEGSARAGKRHNMLQALPRLWLELLAVTGLAVLVFVMLLQGKTAAGIIPTLGLFAAAAFRLLPSCNRALNALQSLRYSLPAVETLHTELVRCEELPAAGPVTRTVMHTGFQLKRLGFSYPGVAQPTLNQISVTVPRGAAIGFVGESGAGKSTLIDVILGLLEPTHGTVCVDGRDVHENLRGWQAAIGYVPQTIFLTDDTLRQNVAFGISPAAIDDRAVENALNAAQLDEFVRQLPAGLDTMVGERGVRLSGGQRQRIGIARALYHNPDILVLDEATSALDGVTERGVMDAVNSLHGTKTILIVAHRLSTVAQCDRIYRIENGRLTEQPAMLAGAQNSKT
jgi:ABC-type multidrug transport system fused ATPase/permease subunit